MLRRMRKNLALVCTILTATACARPWLVKTTEVVTLAPNEGLVAFATVADGVMSLALCKDADLALCMELGPVRKEAPLVISRVREGRWCVMEIICDLEDDFGALVDTKVASEAECFDVAAGHIAYPGHFEYEVQPTQTSLVITKSRFQPRTEESVRALVDGMYPHLANIVIKGAPMSPFAVPDD